MNIMVPFEKLFAWRGHTIYWSDLAYPVAFWETNTKGMMAMVDMYAF
jgi:hypothetical protein